MEFFILKYDVKSWILVMSKRSLTNEASISKYVFKSAIRNPQSEMIYGILHLEI